MSEQTASSVQGLRAEAGNALVSPVHVRPWAVKGQNVGTFQPAGILTALPGFGGIDPAQLTGKTMRQMGPGQQDGKGRDVGGYFVVSDAGAALLFDDPKVASRWAANPNQVNIDIAESLTYVASGHSSVSLLNFTKI